MIVPTNIGAVVVAHPSLQKRHQKLTYSTVFIRRQNFQKHVGNSTHVFFICVLCTKNVFNLTLSLFDNSLKLVVSTTC